MQEGLRIKLKKGRLVAAAVAASWREHVHEFNLDEAELDEVTPLLYGSGAASLGWKRVSKTDLRNTASAELLHQAYRLHSLQAAIHEQKIAKLFGLLSGQGIDAILGKGWAAASLYSDTALRPYGDIDLCVRPEHYEKTEKLLRSPEAQDCPVDLHRQFFELRNRSFDELFERSRLVPLNGEPVRILGTEDHLGLLCIHLLRHGAWRPLWLCDVGAAVESLAGDFDWALCLGRSKTRANWIQSAIALAELLLEARPRHVPQFHPAELPDWLTENVLLQWSHPFAGDQPPLTYPVPITDLLLQPSNLLQGLRNRWPNAIIATISVNGKFNKLPRLPYQLANCAARVAALFGPSGA
jgi:Uncharacterised nucleotidyltransferase